MTHPIAQLVFAFADKTHTLPEHILNSEGWGWDAYAGIRYGFLHIALELRKLAAKIVEKRAQQGVFLTRAQKLLAQHRAAYRDFQALLVGIDDELLDRIPPLGEWKIRTILTHVHEAERYFYAHILNALDNENPQPLDKAQRQVITGTPEPDAEGSFIELWASYDHLHQRIGDQLVRLNNDELAVLSPMWEPESLPIEFRMLRFAAHIREHANQLEKSLWQLDCKPNEAKLLLRQIYAALAEAEGEMIGAGELCNDLCQATIEVLEMRMQAMLAAVDQAQTVIKAVEVGDSETLRVAIDQNKNWARGEMPDRSSLLVYSKYRGQQTISELLLNSLEELSFYEAAMVGNLGEIEAWLKYQPEVLNQFARDGFTGLQLACFFEQPAVTKRLLDAGADVHAVSQNKMRIQPIHAAVAAYNLEIVKMLIAAGCDINARQQDDFTPLMGALQNKDEEMAGVLRKAGAKE